METSLAASTNKYEFFSGRDINAFIEEPKTMSFTIQELYMGSDEFPVPETQGFPGKFSETEAAVDHKEANDVVESFQEDEVSDLGDEEADPGFEISSVEQVSQDQDQDQEQGNLSEAEFSTEKTDFQEERFDFSNGVESSSENNASTRESEPVPNILSDGSSRKDHSVDSITYEFSRESDREYQTPPPPPAIDEENEENSGVGVASSVEHHNDSEDEYIELEPHEESTPTSLESKFFSEEKHQEEEAAEEKNGQDELEYVWEHDDVIEQLKWELKNARTGGLPTILEEESDSESPEREEDLNLKPLKIDLKFGYKDRMEEIQKVYRIYAEKMRKLDILNNQTMHAVGKLIKFR